MIVKGMRKPKSCTYWYNGQLKTCILLDENDNCKAQKVKGQSWEKQFENCPIILINRTHGEIVDMMRGTVLLEAEDETWHRKGT